MSQKSRHRRKKASVHILQSQADEIDAAIASEAIPQTTRDEFVRYAVEASLASVRQAQRAASERAAGLTGALAPGIKVPEALGDETPP